MSLNALRLCLCLVALPAFALPVFADGRGWDVRDMVALERVSSPKLSPDGGLLLMLQRKMTAEGAPETGVYLRHLLTRDLAAPRRLTPEGWNASAPAFSPDGRLVYFLSDHGGSQQLYALDVNGGEPRPLTQFGIDIDTWRLSPDGRKIAFSARTFADCGITQTIDTWQTTPDDGRVLAHSSHTCVNCGADFACTRARLDARKAAKASGVVYERLFVRHWDTWADGRRNRLFVADLPPAGGAAMTQASSGHEMAANSTAPRLKTRRAPKRSASHPVTGHSANNSAPPIKVPNNASEIGNPNCSTTCRGMLMNQT